MDTSQKTIRVLLADDHPIMRDGLRSSIDFEPDMSVVGEASDGQEALDRYRELLPDVALIDLQMPNADGLQAIQAIRALYPDACLVVLTTYPGDARVRRALESGAIAYLLKTADRQDMLAAIRAAAAGRRVLAKEAADDLHAHEGYELLTPRELSVLRLVAEGNGNRDIAQKLCISEDTVKARMKTILDKLDAEDRTHAVTIALRRGFMD
ncbi:response regulator transcription factor [Dyella telluris]|uniref:Response regulator transcription factor n=1 Tax=Dyella telluris TaxID=2763498 RepID=A0A7G8Q3F4_9GAMM|nr:response regulator transcription factor [Dyella telluris]QNK01312.1 response regulator transcription factor [Dyella telluris]